MPWLKGLLAAGLLASAAQAQDIACVAPAKPMLRAEMMFGRNVDGRPGVTEAGWRQFVVRELTPRFPDGLTVIDARGQWRDANGAPVRERAKLVIVVTADDSGSRARIAAAAAAYKARFRQKSVGVLMRPVCAAF